ncbi:MAG: sulfatase-like hydrolase/transferase [Rhodospirillaceae bacterium]|nr:sulfatase-like hydrolase/transferase [Rhodospirillaceae bacterium]
MSERALGSAPRIAVRLALALVFVAAAAIYSVVYEDPYVALLILPFFALGVARGKHPVILATLSLLPAAVLLAISVGKAFVTNIPLVAYDHFFLRGNVLMLAYNDWRVASGVLLTLAAIFFYAKALLSGRGTFTLFEKGGVAALVLVSGFCIYAMRTEPQIAIWDPALTLPTIKTFVKSTQAPSPQLHLLANAEAAQPPAEHHGLTAPAERPDIFFLLQESTFLPEVLQPEHKSKHMFAGRAAQRGPLKVHTYGGGTWRTEFSLTTQMRPQEFGGDGLYVFHQLEGRVHRSIFTELKKLGYRTVVFYPVPGFFINAAPFYASIGVDEFYDAQSLGIATGWDWKIPDEAFYKAMLKKLEGSDKPVVAFMLTISQHGPHATQDPMADYVQRFDTADKAYGDFMDALKARGRRAGVVTFGDHQPEFTLRFISSEKARHLTTYDVRCVNFSCDGDSDNPVPKPLDIVMLAPAALERFGFGLDDLSLAQRKAFHNCEGDTDACVQDERLEFNTAFSHYFE